MYHIDISVDWSALQLGESRHILKHCDIVQHLSDRIPNDAIAAVHHDF